MGAVFDTSPKKAKNLEGNEFDPTLINLNFDKYIFENKFIDIWANKYNFKDPVFKLVQKEEKYILDGFCVSKKEEFQNFISNYLLGQNLNFVKVLTKQIISNENGEEIMSKKIEKEINYIKTNKTQDRFKLKYLTIIGLSGAGKSCLINSLLFNGKEVAKEGCGYVITKNTTPYQSKTVPNLRLVDKRGMELCNRFGFDIDSVSKIRFIEQERQINDLNYMVHCIWYCITITHC